MMTRSIVALVAAAALALQAAILHAAVAAPLSSALGELRERACAEAAAAPRDAVAAVPAPAPRC